MKVGPSDPALFISKYMCGAKIKAESFHLVVKLDGHQIEIEIVPEHYLLEDLI